MILSWVAEIIIFYQVQVQSKYYNDNENNDSNMFKNINNDNNNNN